ncbi:MAG TPA: hypothetical protein VKR06_26085 [Ktedonosporobacter sp.]|nr:hypothetical protein [Ktedonosporobacter sp.]
MSQHYPGDLPTIPLDQNGLRSIDALIQGYLPHLVRKQPAPQRIIAVLRTIRRKLVPMLKPGGFPEGTAIPLTLDELWALDLACQGFATLISSRINSSKERDGLLADLDKLHQYCESLLSHRRKAL